MIRRLAPRRPLNPLLLRRVAHSNINKNVIARASGFPHYVQFFTLLRSKEIIGTPLTVGRLLRVAEVVGFPADEVFLDEPPTPRLVKASRPSADAEAPAR